MKITTIYVPSFKGRRRRPLWPRILLALVLAGALAFAVLFGLVMQGARDQISGEPEVMVILGCQVKPWGPSILLQDRLDEALDYLEDHPGLPVVASGGQGSDEHISEAQAMFDYLTRQGVPAEQILLEEASHNTYENLTCTRDLMKEAGLEDKMDQVILVSNGFHLTRTRMLFERVWEGEFTLSTLAAPSSHVPSRMKMYVREPLALVKSYLLDR